MSTRIIQDRSTHRGRHTLLCASIVAAMFSHMALANDGYQVPRTEHGHPDIQGIWTNASQTPLERPREYGTQRAYTDEQRREREQGWIDYIEERNQPSDPDRPPPTDGNTALGYDNFWVDRGTEVVEIGGEYRTSIIIEPEDGRIAYIEGANRFRNARPEGRGPFDGPEARPLGERCIISFGSAGGPPMLPIMYNNNYQIVQTADYVMILVEMVNDARIVKLNRDFSEHNKERWLGESIGYYDGDTLVVKTTHINPQQSFRGASPELVSTEYFTRVADNRIEYRFELDDPSVFAATVVGEVAMHRRPDGDRMFEYACHEGNYALPGVLAGERVREHEAAQRQR